MGQEILYCYKCQTRLLGSEFEKGKAFKVGAQASCAKCVKDLLGHVPDVGSESERGRRMVSTTRIPAVPTDSSSKFKTLPTRTPSQGTPAAEKPKSTLLLGLGAGALVLVGLAVLAMNSGSSTRRTDSDGPPAPPPPATSRGGHGSNPPVTPAPGPAPAGFAAELREIDEKLRNAPLADDYRAAAALLEEARKRRNTPEWLSEIDLRLPQVEGRARRASVPLRDQAIEAQKRGDAAAVKSLKDRVAAWGFPSVVEEFDRALAEAANPAPQPPPPATPDPPPPPPVQAPPMTLPSASGPPIVLYDDKLGRGIMNHSWSGKVNLSSTDKVFEGSTSIAFSPEKAWGAVYLGIEHPIDVAEYPYVTFAVCPSVDHPMVLLYLWGTDKSKSTVQDLAKLGGTPKAGQWKRYIAPTAASNPTGGKVHGFVLQTGQVPAGTTVYVDSIAFLRSKSDAAPAPVAPTRWSQAALKAGARDYEAAIKLLEDPADVELFKLASQVPVEAAKVVDKWAKGQKVRFEYLGPSGERIPVEGPVVSADALRVSIAREDGSFDVPVSEFAPGTLAELFRSRADKKPTDARAAAAFCALEGDVEGVKRYAAENAAIPERYLAAAQKHGAPPEAESAARRLFWAAEADFALPRRRGPAIEKYGALLAGSDAARLHPYIAARMEAAKDTLFLADDLSGRGSFQPAGSPKIEMYWGSTADSSAAKAKENYVEAEFIALPGVAYRAWVWAGGCCQETFDASWQGSELTAPNPKNSREPISCEPGSDSAPALKVPTSLRKWHAQHGGPKEPARWEWLPLALPKYETPGPKRIRILTAQQGFSVAAVAVYGARREPPRDAEMKEIEKARTPSRKAGGNEPTGSILHEWWWNIPGAGIEDLTKSGCLQNKPGGTALRTAFESDRDIGDRYAARMRGFIHAPITGNYVFWIASDDGGELFLSTDESALKKRSIATCPPAAGFRDWNRWPTCKSAPIPLVAGKRYYIEALHKENDGNDHISVGWTLPDGSDERPIPGKRLSPWSNIAPAPAPAAGPPGMTFLKAFNIGGPPTTIDGRKWEGKGSPDLATSGEFENQSVPLNPPTDEARAAMIRTSAFSGGSTSVKVYNLAPGAYYVYLYIWEDNGAQTMDLFVQGKEVMKAYNSGAAGHWERLGPWTAAVGADGVLQVHSTGGDANFSGLEIWKPSGK